MPSWTGRACPLPGSLTAHTFNLRWPTGFNSEVVLNVKWNNQSQPTHQTECIDYTHYTEVEIEEGKVTPGERVFPGRHLRSRTRPHSASGKRVSPHRVSRSRSPLPRRGCGTCQHNQTDTASLPQRPAGEGQSSPSLNNAPEQTAEPVGHHRVREDPPRRTPSKRPKGKDKRKGQGKGKQQLRAGKGQGKDSTTQTAATAQIATSPFAVSPFAATCRDSLTGGVAVQQWNSKDPTNHPAIGLPGGDC